MKTDVMRDPDRVTPADGVVDLRSDTVTRPTAEMRRAMAEAEVGDEVICEERSHVNLYELASMSAIAGCMPRVARAEDGILSWKLIEAVIRPKIYYDSQTALICLENTVNMWGGTVYPTEQVDEVCERAHEAGLKVHLDGARVFNAATALGEK